MTLRYIKVVLAPCLLTTVLMMALTVEVSVAAPPPPPDVDGRFYGDGDENIYLFLAEDPGRGTFYYYLDGDTLYVAMVVDTSVNDNVFGWSKMHDPDRAYLDDALWGKEHTAGKLIGSDHIEFVFTCGAASWTWKQDYVYNTVDQNELFRTDWLSGPAGPDGGGAPPPGLVSASSMRWNFNNTTWDYTLGDCPGGSRCNDNRKWKSVDDDGDNDIDDEEGWLWAPDPPGHDGFNDANQWEWAMVYEMSFDIGPGGANCSSNPISVRVVTAHNSPSKDGVPDVPIEETDLVDYGDAPDGSYLTLLASNGARHNLVVNGPFMGADVDAEADGQPGPNASGDDVDDGNDDEDGVILPAGLVPGDPAASVAIDMTNSPQGCRLNAWIDFDRSGAWDQLEQIFTDEWLTSGAVHNLTFAVPAGAALGSTYARFRCSTQSGLSSNGLASDGEVEDYVVEIVELFSLGDLVWYDTDQDGIQDGGEPGVQGIEVDLYDDAGCTGNITGTDTTDANGIYGFTGLTAGTYCISFTVPATYTVSPQDQGTDDAKDSDVNLATAQITNISLTADDFDEDVGLYVPGSIGDTVWCDADLEGDYDAGEGVAGVTVSLWKDTDCNGTADVISDTKPTAGDGQYLFTGLIVGPPGGPAVCYVVEVDETAAALGTCNNPITPISYTVQLEANNPDDLDNDFGFSQLLSLGDLVWYDTDQDGIQDGGEPGVQGIEVDLYDDVGCTGDITGTATTDANGIYGFTGLTGGSYCISFTVPATYTVSPQDQGADDAEDSDATATAQISNINLTASDLDEDVGLYVPGSIGDRVWCDADFEGDYDVGEGVAGVTVSLWKDTDCNGTADVISATQDTVGDGQYLFDSLIVGPPGGPPVCYVVEVDETGMGACDNPITPISYTVQLEANNPGDDDNDFGFNQLLSLGDLVWYDTDQDGIQDGGEPGVQGIEVDLYDDAGCTGQPIKSDTTGADGIYGFTGLTADTYCISFTVPAVYTVSLQNRGADDVKDSDAIRATAQITNINLTTDDLDEDVGLYVPGSIGDRVWCDANYNSLYDGGEGVDGVTVSLYADINCDTVPEGLLTSQDTTGDGYYLFDDLIGGPPGGPPVCYVVQVDVGDVEPCNNPVTPSEYNDALEANNPDDLEDDFGFNQLLNLGDYVWYDDDGDGIQDVDEPVASGVHATLFNSADCIGSALDSDTTDASGNYLFTDLLPGTYCVEFSNIPAGWIVSPQDQGTDDEKDSDANPAAQIQNIVFTADDLTQDVGLQYAPAVGGVTRPNAPLRFLALRLGSGQAPWVGLAALAVLLLTGAVVLRRKRVG